MRKSVFITGAQSGTGYGIAEYFAKQGWDVFFTSLWADQAEAAAKKLSEDYGIFSKGYEFDMLDESRIIEIFRDIDYTGRFAQTIVLNAANMGFGNDPAKGLDFFTVSKDEFGKVLETNLVGNFVTARQAAIRMKDNGGGAIVFIGSNTSYRAIPNRAAYSASKGGINSMSKAFAVDLGKYGIRSNVVLPGTIKTQRWVEMGSKQIVNGTLTPIGDISDFEDVAAAAFFLGTELSKNITGAEITVDGGMTAQLYPNALNDMKRKLMELGEI